MNKKYFWAIVFSVLAGFSLSSCIKDPPAPPGAEIPICEECFFTDIGTGDTSLPTQYCGNPVELKRYNIDYTDLYTYGDTVVTCKLK